MKCHERGLYPVYCARCQSTLKCALTSFIAMIPDPFLVSAWRATQAIHNAEHRKERAYADDVWTKGAKRPMDITALNIDAPTQD
eukprot:1729747-Pleurochrysis_carterae.AAC.1